MKKMNMLKFVKILSLPAMALGLLIFTGCGGDDEEPAPTMTLAEIIAADPELTQLADFLENDSELKGYIEGSAEYTVFAPNNAAFEKLKATLGIDDLSVIAPNVIGGVLRFHFVSGTKLSSDLYGSSAKTLQGENVSVTSAGFVNEAGSDADGSEILEKDVKATNGVLYKVETILIPPPVFAQIGLNLGTLAQPILLGADFTDVVSIIAVADASVPSGELSISAMLANKSTEAGYTAFIPSNGVLDAVAASKGVSKADLIASVSSSAQVARGFLLNHIAAGKILGDDLAEGTLITMKSGLTFVAHEVAKSTQTPTGWVLILSTDQTKVFPIFATDVYKAIVPDENNEPVELDGAINGALHVSAPLIVQ